MTNNEFDTAHLDRIIDEEAWKDLSREFKWTLPYLTRYADRVDWKAVSGNKETAWSSAMLEAFKDRIDWHELSGTSNQALFTTANLDRFAAYWDWCELSENENILFTIDLLDRYADRWDWTEILHNYGVDRIIGLDRAFLVRFKKHIPVSQVQYTYLWTNLVGARELEAANRMLSEDA